MNVSTQQAASPATGATLWAAWLGLVLLAMLPLPSRAQAKPASQPAATVSPAEVVVGQVAPLSGVLASTGRQMVLGGRIYFDWVNEQGGIHGARLNVQVVDDGYKVGETVRSTRDLLGNPEVVALFGFAGTANVGQLLQDGVLAQAGVPLVAPYTGGESLRNPYNPWVFHVRAGYADEAEHMVQHLSTVGIDRVAVLYQNDGFGKAGLAGVEAAMSRRERKVLAAASYERNTDRVDQAVRIIRDAQPQAVILVAVNKPAAAFARQYREAGGGGVLYSISVVDPAELVRLGGLDSVRGMGISQVVPHPYGAVLPVIREYQRLLKRYAPDEPVSYTSFEQFLGAKVLVEALRRAGPRPSRAKVLSALENLGSFDLGGWRVAFGPGNRVGSRMVDITVIGADGRLRK